ATILMADGSEKELDLDAVKWARMQREDGRLGPVPTSVNAVVKTGDIIRLQRVGERWILAQIPEATGALVAISPDDGAIKALVGGFDFWHGGEFNRVTQAQRQPGSAYKAFLYSAALEHGFGLNTVVNDSPVVIKGGVTTGVDWRPRNYSGRFYGPTRLREALVRSQNLVSVRLLEAITPQQAIEHTQRFGIPTENWQPTLSMAQGSYSINPLDMTVGYAAFANGGYRLSPYVIAHYHSQDGVEVYDHPPVIKCDDCTPDDISESIAPRIISAQNAFLIRSALQDVTQRGTAAAAGRELQRRDIGGKTGTTNDMRDAWFVGFGPGYVATAWVGFDDYRPLGRQETGGRTALPMWIDFMKQVLPPEVESDEVVPEGIALVSINPATGRQVSSDTPGAVLEYIDITHRGMDELMGNASVIEEDRPDLVTDLF
ncbi:MAG TPA: peptidase, partial [Halothiobacillus sp.]|nr:peptidase [Halothiobacillus sp.]